MQHISAFRSSGSYSLIPAHVVGSLATHRAIDCPGYTVTHIKTGLRVAGFSSAQTAKAFMRKAHELPWHEWDRVDPLSPRRNRPNKKRLEWWNEQVNALITGVRT